VADVVAIAGEMLAWPVRIWLGAAEIAGRAVLAAWRSVGLPLIGLVLRASAFVLRLAEREVTPVRGLAVVALAATIGLGASQFSDYHAVEVGAPDYQGVENVAPAPQIDQESPRSAHGVTVFAIAIVALFATAFAVTRNWRLARLLPFLGAAVVLISLLVDLHQGLRTGSASIAYEGAEAVLLGGFWAQLACGATLIIVGPLLSAQLRVERRARRPQRAGRTSRTGVAPGAVPASTGRSGAEGAAT